MEKKQNKAPLVRFPEFKEDWKFINGNELFKTISNKDHNSDLPILAISQEFGAIPRELINYNISVTNKSVSSYKVIEVGDFIISLRSFEGGIEYSNYKGICSPAYIILRPTVKLERNFYRVHFKTFRYIQQLQSKLEGIRDGKMISYKYFSEIKLPFPTLPEQQKIAHFFTTLDKKIDQLQEKKNALEQYKKGMMQKLFSQEIRFQDDKGEDYPDWEEKKLGEYIEVISGYAFKGDEISENKNGIPLLRGINIQEGFIRHSKQIDRFYEGDIKKLNKYFLKLNDLVIGMDGSKVGKNVSLVSKTDVNSLLIQRVARLRANELSNIRFIFQIIFSNWFIRYVDIVNNSSGIPHISLKQINDFNYKFPTLQEQNKIANFLSKIDDKIDTVKQQIKKTKTYKKGLLQKMFV